MTTLLTRLLRGGKLRAMSAVTGLIEAFTSGHMTRDALIEHLVKFPYAQPTEREEFDGVWDGPAPVEPNTWREVESADNTGKLPRDVFMDVLRAREAAEAG